MFGRKPQPKYEPLERPGPSQEQAIIDAMNGLEACIDWRKGNTDTNLILDDRKWKMWERAASEGTIPTFNEKTGKWEAH